MEKKPTNSYFSISVGKEKKYMNVFITSDEEATGNADTAAGSNIGNADTAAGSNIGSADAADSNIGNADTAAGSNIGSAYSADSNIGSADVAGSNIGSADAAGSNIGNAGAADGVSAEGSQDRNFTRVVSVNALAPAKEILLTLPVQNIPDEALASILSYIAKRDAVADSSIYYGPLVTALVRSRYSEDEVEAIVNNALMVQNMPSSCNEIEERSIASEFEDFQNFRLQCKARAKKILSLMTES